MWVRRDGEVYYIAFEDGGKVTQPLKVIGNIDPRETGTKVRFKPDETIFKETTTFSYEVMRDRIRQLAFLNKGLRLTLIDERENPTQKIFHL